MTKKSSDNFATKGVRKSFREALQCMQSICLQENFWKSVAKIVMGAWKTFSLRSVLWLFVRWRAKKRENLNINFEFLKSCLLIFGLFRIFINWWRSGFLVRFYIFILTFFYRGTVFWWFRRCSFFDEFSSCIFFGDLTVLPACSWGFVFSFSRSFKGELFSGGFTAAVFLADSAVAFFFGDSTVLFYFGDLEPPRIND